jgi:hypothetical protein
MSKYGTETRIIIAKDQEIQIVSSVSKVMLHCFGTLTLKHFHDCGQVNNAWYCVVLEEEFKPAVHSRHRRMLTNGVVLHHDNA